MLHSVIQSEPFCYSTFADSKASEDLDPHTSRAHMPYPPVKCTRLMSTNMPDNDKPK